MRHISIAAALSLGILASAASAQAAPLSAAGALGGETTRAVLNDTTVDEAVATPVRYHGRRVYRHYGWNRGHHYGWRNRYYAPRHYGYAPRYYAPRNYGYGYGPGVRFYW